MCKDSLTIYPFQREIPLSDFVRECVSVPKFLECCKQCPKYGNTWSCPPFSFSAEQVWAEYDTLLLYGYKICLSEELQSKVWSPESISLECGKLLKPYKREIHLKLLQMEKDIPGSRALSAGSCDFCPDGNCARRKGQPCRQPDWMRESAEALGCDVGKTLDMYLHEKLVWAKDGHMPEHFILLGGLLMHKYPKKPLQEEDVERETETEALAEALAKAEQVQTENASPAAASSSGEQESAADNPPASEQENAAPDQYVEQDPLKCHYSFYQNRECEFFPCHKVDNPEDFNCLYCYCPLYALGSHCGGDFHYMKNGIKDCSQCQVPHNRAAVLTIQERFKDLAALAEKNR